ncbi:MAG: hypothetical protein QCI00_07910 [Candidatus Thermoplasmatota archaeon]|nr:hypothetical protein [Candidatus Thermoplasmatota archaeon]
MELDDRNLRIWDISTYSIIYLLFVVFFGIVAWIITDNIFPHFVLLFSTFLMGITIIFLVRVRRVVLLGRSEFIEKSPLFNRIKDVFNRVIGPLLICIVVILGLSFALWGIGMSTDSDKSNDNTSTLLITLGFTLLIHAFSLHQVNLANKNNKQLIDEISELKAIVKYAYNEK